MTKFVKLNISRHMRCKWL